MSHPLNFLVKPKEDTPESHEKLKTLTLFNTEQPSAATLIHNAWANGLREITLNGVECTIEVLPDEPRQEEGNSMSTADIGEKIKDAIESFRDEAFRATCRADKIEEAWKEWDVDSLFRLGVISNREAEYIRKEKSK